MISAEPDREFSVKDLAEEVYGKDTALTRTNQGLRPPSRSQTAIENRHSFYDRR